jgi:hypothetical protein
VVRESTPESADIPAIDGETAKVNVGSAADGDAYVLLRASAVTVMSLRVI